MKLQSYSICGPVKNTCKSHAIWITGYGVSSPLVYLIKPKWVDPKKWEEIVNSIKLELPINYEV